MNADFIVIVGRDGKKEREEISAGSAAEAAMLADYFYQDGEVLSVVGIANHATANLEKKEKPKSITYKGK